MQDRLMQSYHKALPSIVGAKNNYENVTSDHAPILAVIGDIKIVSWNVLENDIGSGFASNGDIRFRETDEQRFERHKRIASSLARFVDKHAPQFITLQEIKAVITDRENEDDAKLNDSLYELIRQTLGDDYACVIENDELIDSGGCITFYRTEQFEQINCDEDRTSYNGDLLGGNVTKFKYLNNVEREVRIANVHHRFSENILNHEENIKTFLTGKDEVRPIIDPSKETLSIVIGDFNGTVGALNGNPRNLTTSVSPSFLRKDDPEIKTAIENDLQIQGAWSIDGCFFSHRLKDRVDVESKQAFVDMLNPNSGDCYTEQDLAPLSLEGLPELQQKEIMKQRPFICVDESHKQNKCIGDKTIFEYEDEVKEKLRGEKIFVRRTTNLNNQKGIAIISKELAAYFSLLKHPDFHVNVIEDFISQSNFCTVCVSDDHVLQLIEEINFIEKNKELYDLAIKIVAMESSRLADIEKRNKPRITSEVIDEFKKLFTSLRNEPNRKQEPYSIVVEHFTNLADKVASRKEKINLQEIKQFAKELDEKLYGKKNLDISKRAIIGAIIGGLVGAACGIAIGAVLTGYIGCFGAIPGMVVGMASGCAIGAAIAVGTTTLSAALGSGLGIFSVSYKGRKAYQANKEKIKQSLSQPIREAEKHIYTALKASC